VKNLSRAVVALWLFGLAMAVAAKEPGKAPASVPTAPADGTRAFEKPASVVVDPSYIIGPQDVLEISVWKEPDFTTRTAPVRPDGKISLPLINDVQAAGLTPVQLAASLAVMLRKYLTQPQVTVIVTQTNSKRVYVLGEMNHPGPIPLLPGLTVLQALSSAGGFNQFANQKKIYVLRTEGGKETRYPFNYKKAIRGDITQNILLQAGDTIVVP
jgi:polysaccharide export outer membrane protein